MKTKKTVIKAEPGKQELFITREFDAPRELVFRAHTDPKLFVRWLGPREYTMKLERLDAKTGALIATSLEIRTGTSLPFAESATRLCRQRGSSRRLNSRVFRKRGTSRSRRRDLSRSPAAGLDCVLFDWRIELSVAIFFEPRET